MKFLIVAGEESGEIYGAGLMREIKKLNPEAGFEGIGGDRMEAEGLSVIRHCREMASIGVVNLLKNITFFLVVLNGVRDRVANGNYDAVILIDYPDFNLRVARAGFDAGIPVFYYVCPQFWAWRRYRIRSVRKWVDTMLVALPFEEGFYRERNVNAKFIGHPMLDEISVPPDRAALKDELLPEGAKTLVGLMPGSRKSEVIDMMERLVEVADAIHAKREDTGFVIPVAPNIPMELIKPIIKDRPYFKTVTGGSHRVMAASDLLITKSGTSSLEAAIIGVPMLIVYRFSFISYWIGRMLVYIEYSGLPNIIAGREVAKEFLQYNFQPDAVAREALSLLDDPEKLARAKRDMEEVRMKLGEKGAASRAAVIIIGRMADRK